MAAPDHPLTVTPRGIALGGGTLPVSIFVSPRLYRSHQLGAFPDWGDWTAAARRRRSSSSCAAPATATVSIDRTPLRPDLWRALFAPTRSCVRTSSTTIPGAA